MNLRLEVQSTGFAGKVYALTPDGLTSQLPDPSNPAFGGLAKAYKQSLEIQHPSIAAGLRSGCL